MHTLFVREHNRLANLIQSKYPEAGDEEVYELARKLVGAEQQIVTYEEFLPALLGSSHAPRLRAYSGFDPRVDPSIGNEFSTVAYRFGHSMLSSTLQLADANGVFGSMELRDVFFNPVLFDEKAELVDQFLGGFLLQQAQEIDPKINDDVRNHLFSSPNGQGSCLDLAALNIQRGRDHGILGYNGVREAANLEPKRSWAKVTSDVGLQNQLAASYPLGVDSMDAWIGALAEDHVEGGSVGELVATVIADQFQRLMDGDKYFYKNDSDLTRPGLEGIWLAEDVTLEKIIRDNTMLQISITSDGAFFV